MTRRRERLLQSVATSDCKASSIQDLEKMDLWESSHPGPLQDTEGRVYEC